MLCSPLYVGLIHRVYILAIYMLSELKGSYLNFRRDKAKARSIPDHRLASSTAVGK